MRKRAGSTPVRSTTGSAGSQASGGDSKRPNFISRGESFVFINRTRPAVPAPKHRVAIAKDRTSSHEDGVLFLYRIVEQKNLAAGEDFLYHKLRNISAAAPMLNPIPSLKRIFSPIKITEISVVRMNPPVAWPG